MKVAILTLSLHNNYGGILQNFALQRFLANNGFEPITINWTLSHTQSGSIISILRDFKSVFLHFAKGSALPKYKLTFSEESYIGINNIYFIDKYIVKTELLESIESIIDLIKHSDFGAVVVGSDQCWRPRYIGKMLPLMFLNFFSNNKIRKISYAASFGTDVWEFNPVMTNMARDWIKQFQLVSVREQSGVRLCKEFLNVESQWVLDPTFLLSKEEYISIVESESVPKSDGNLMYYFLDPSVEKLRLINNIATANDFVPFTAMPKYQAENRTKNNVKQEIDSCVYPGVLVWLRGFIDADLIICDSFHGCVFSIIFNKKFWVINNKDRGNARLESLLRMFGLEERLIPADRLDIVYDGDSIEWNKINTIINSKKDYSGSILKKSLLDYA